MTQSWRKSFAVYADPRVLSIFLFGFASGLPLLLVKSGSTLGAWLTDAQVDLTAITMLAWAGIPYSLKFLWAPFLDRLEPPAPFARLGRRRGWMLLLQLGLAASILLLAFTEIRTDNLWLAGLAVMLVAFFSASQDVVVDAYRIDILKDTQQAAGATMVQSGYRIAMLIAGAGALWLAEHFLTWPQVYMVMAALGGVGMLATLLNPEPKAPDALVSPVHVESWLKDAVVRPFGDMIQRQGWALLGIIAFILSYKLCDAIPGSLATPFYLQIGFSKDEVAAISKVFGFGATMVGLALGGVLAVRMGLMRALFLGGILQAISNLMYVYLTIKGHDPMALIITIAVENVSGSIGSAVFVAYLSRLCNLNYSATQYALLSSLATVGTNFISGFSGMIVASISWIPFFIFTTLTGLPALVLLIWLMRRFPEATRDT